VQEESQQTLSAQLPDPHSVPAAHAAPLALRPDWQAPLPSQYCVPLQAGLESWLPAGMFTQLPRLPTTPQDWQVPVQALLQQ
jgi:hypothetical protein